MLSGGIDSSAIAAAAVAASRELGQPLPVLLSAVYPGLDCDEQPAQAAVARHLGAPHVVHDATRVALWPALGEAVRVSLSPLVDGQEGINLGLYQAAREQGCDVVLHGAGGDELFEGRGLEVDLMRSGRWIQAAGLIHSALIARPGPTVRTWLRRGLRYPIQPARMGPRTADRVEAGSWCRALVRRTLADSGLDWRLEMAERTARRAGLRFAAPYLESGFLGEYERISSPELACGGVFKGQLRRSLAGRLPSDVVTNLKKVRLAAYYRARLAVDGEPMSRAYAELIKDYPVDWLPRSIGHLLKRPISPQEFLPLWMGLAILLFIDALSNTSRRIR
jgi:asparagine synthetase B (glutamine-hydrolysing)